MTSVSITKQTNKRLEFYKEIAVRANKQFGTRFNVQRDTEIADRENYSVLDEKNPAVALKIYVIPAYPPEFPLPSVGVYISVNGSDVRFTLQTITEFCRKISTEIGNSIKWVSASIDSKPAPFYTIRYVRDSNEKAYFDRLQVYHKELIHGEPFVIYESTLPVIEGATEVIWESIELEEIGTHKKITVGFKLFAVSKKPEAGCIGLVGKALNPPHGLMALADNYEALQEKICEELEKRGLKLITNLVSLIAASKKTNRYEIEWK